MPRATLKRPKLDPSKLYVAWEPVSVGTRTFSRGSRVRGDDPILREIGWAFIEDGASDAEVAIRDVDAQVWSAPSPEGRALSAAPGVLAGQRVPKDDPLVRKHPGAFVPVTNGVERSEAVVAKTTFRHLDGDDGDVRVVYAGQWLRRSDPLVAAHRHQVRPPDPEPL